jgi:hypothetical protein
MKALIFTLAVAIFPCAAQAGEAVTYEARRHAGRHGL